MKTMEPHDLPGNIFMQPWWLDIVAPGRWMDVKVEKGNEIFARWPIVTRREKGFTFIEMPKLTQKLGPWIKQTSSKTVSVHNNERSILKKLIEQLPRFDKFQYNLDPEINSHLPFIWEGFTQTSRITFQIAPNEDVGKLFQKMKSSVRRNIRRAEEKLEIDQTIDTDNLYDQITRTFLKQNLKPPFSKELLSSLYSEASKRNRAEILGAMGKYDQLQAAIILIHDDNTTYYLAGGSDPDSTIPGALSLLLWSAIKKAIKENRTFDFEGSSLKPIEHFFSSFGAEVVHFHQINGISKRFAPIYHVKQLVKKLNS